MFTLVSMLPLMKHNVNCVLRRVSAGGRGSPRWHGPLPPSILQWIHQNTSSRWARQMPRAAKAQLARSQLPWQVTGRSGDAGGRQGPKPQLTRPQT